MALYGKVIIVKTFLIYQFIYHVNWLHINNLYFPKLQTIFNNSVQSTKKHFFKKEILYSSKGMG